MSTRQVGLGLVSLASPEFPGFEIVDKTWKEKDALQVEASRGGDGNMKNYTGWSPGIDAQCDWWTHIGTTPAGTLDIVVENLVIFPIAQPVANNAIIIGLDTYKFVAALSVGPAVPFEVLIGATLTATLANLVGAIGAVDAGGQAPGTTFGTGTTANTAATAVIDLVHGTLVLTQITPWALATALAVSGTWPGAKIAFIALSALTAPVMARAFIVQDGPEKSNFGGGKVKQSLKLKYHADGFSPVKVS